jgi:diguanylate cyclase
MHSLIYIVPWVFGSVSVGVLVGFFVGRSRAGAVRESTLVQHERRATLQVLVELLKSAQQLNDNVECHNSEMRETADQVGNLSATGEMETVREALLGQIADLMASNKRLQNDVTYCSYRMEEQAQEIDHARREARTDPLTAVANRKAFDEKLHLLHSDWQRNGDPYVLILVDLDQFKWINDCHGHRAGDRILQKVGAGLKTWVRDGDFVGRYGGDEFAILLPKTELQPGVELAESLRAQIADATSWVALRGEHVSVSLSLGVAAPWEGDTQESLLQRADEALYKSKRLGRNQVTCQGPRPENASAGIEEALSRR